MDDFTKQLVQMHKAARGQMPRNPTEVARSVLSLKAQSPRLFEAPSRNLVDFADVLYQHEYGLWKHMMSWGNEAFRNEMLNLQANVWWERSGLPVFRITESLLAALLLTDSDNVIASDVHFPFNTFMISLPPDFWDLEGLDGSRYPIAMVKVHSYLSHVFPGDTEFRECLMISILAVDGTILWDRLTWPHKGQPFGGWFDNLDVNYQTTVDPTETKLQFNMRRVAVNLALYIAERGKGRKQVKPQSRKQRKRSSKRRAMFAGSSNLEVWTLGHEITLDREVIDAARASVSLDAADQKQWRIKKRFVRRGHHRNQPHGPGRSLRKLIWIAPHWVGPKQGERIAHLYTDGKEDSEK